jgi:predicted MPP superfamily phosphohydrolase
MYQGQRTIAPVDELCNFIRCRQTKDMLTLLHLSDLHITTNDAGSQFDRDVKIRQALLNDLGIEGRTEFDAILVTGDVAYHGRADEFARAKIWLEEVRTKTSSNPEALFVVPGNHDVNQQTVYRSSSLWDLHQTLRDKNLSAENRLASLECKLKDPTLDFLAAQKEYIAFAQEYGCPTSSKELAWVQFLNVGKTLEDGTPLRFHGLNSAILSDGADAKANLLLGEFQFKHFCSDPRYVNVVLCHHPQNWLIDDNESNDFFRKQTHILLSGHEHDARCYREGGSLRVRAGAIHPNHREARWEPCYHVLRLSVDTAKQRELCVRVETRVWQDKDKCFAKFQHDGSDYHEEHIPLKSWSPTLNSSQPLTSSEPAIAVLSAPDKDAQIMTPDAFTAARRKLIVHFFRLGTIARFQAAINAGVWEEIDDALDGQERWARVFDRAEKAGKLRSLWEAIAAEDQSLTGQDNPFKTVS